MLQYSGRKRNEKQGYRDAPHPEAQIDRFLLKAKVGNPRREDERRILELASTEHSDTLPDLEPVVTPEETTCVRSVVDERSLHTLSSIYLHASCILMHMRTTLNIEDSLLERARELTGVKEKTALVRLGLEALIARESARRLAALGGSERKLKPTPRRRTSVT